MTIKTTTSGSRPLDVLLTPTARRGALERDACVGLTSSPKWLPPKYFYDDRGSELFEEITRLPEYYPSRTERALLVAHADDIAATAGAEVLLELGSGSSEKTRLLLDAVERAGRLAAYVPVDVSAGALTGAMDALARERPELALHGVVADFDHHLGHLPAPGGRLVAFLGSTLGNYDHRGRHMFLTQLASGMRAGEHLLLGLDLVKDPARLVAAYDDAAGVTAEFNRNVLHVLNDQLGADFQTHEFSHVAVWDDNLERIEMRLRAARAMTVRLEALDLSVQFTSGEELLTELSCKFRRESAAAELTAAGFTLERWWTDEGPDFALALARR